VTPTARSWRLPLCCLLRLLWIRRRCRSGARSWRPPMRCHSMMEMMMTCKKRRNDTEPKALNYSAAATTQHSSHPFHPSLQRTSAVQQRFLPRYSPFLLSLSAHFSARILLDSEADATTTRHASKIPPAHSRRMRSIWKNRASPSCFISLARVRKGGQRVAESLHSTKISRTRTLCSHTLRRVEA
jgi:hypothetical protein